MLSEKLKVIACDAGTLTLQSQRKSTCNGCELRKGCGQYLLASNAESFSLETGSYLTSSTGKPAVLAAGSEVEIRVQSSAMLAITMLFYILPLGFLMAGVGAGMLFALEEPALVLASFGALGIGVAVSRKQLRKYQNNRVIGINTDACDHALKNME